ncbi:YusW family protein [Bacillus sp. FJAT-22090]|uniref:YusW family protein n=1 Tax=Bacillus sp. FJAT-22090 TaxID=1581038 RepID=UPI00119DAA7E|nr:YusW family protein [Bacillus sp. FJAT-22090]
MKKYSIFGSIFLSTVLLLGACGDKEEVKNAPTEDKIVSEFGFRSFDLEVDTPDHKEAIEASFDIDISETEAEYVNRIEPKDLKGDKAYKELEPIFKELGLTKDMKKDEVIEKVSQAFEVEDYTKFNLEVEFPDGDEKEYKDEK